MERKSLKEQNNNSSYVACDYKPLYIEEDFFLTRGNLADITSAVSSRCLRAQHADLGFRVTPSKAQFGHYRDDVLVVCRPAG